MHIRKVTEVRPSCLLDENEEQRFHVGDERRYVRKLVQAVSYHKKLLSERRIGDVSFTQLVARETVELLGSVVCRCWMKRCL